MSEQSPYWETVRQRRLRLVTVPAALAYAAVLILGILGITFLLDHLLGLPTLVTMAGNFVVGFLASWWVGKFTVWLSNLEQDSREVPPEPNIHF